MSLPARFGYAICMAVAFLMSAEFAARTEDYIRDGIKYSAAPNLTYDLVLRDSLGTRGRPYGHFQKWKLNSAGFRSPESVMTVVAGCTRVMVLGSSETFGAAAESPGKEFPAQLGDSLAHDGCFQVMNAAIVGLAIPGLTQLWNEWASRFHPNIVVILANPLFYLADRTPSVPPRLPRPADPPAWWTPRLLGKAHDIFHYPGVIQRRRVQRMLRSATNGRPRDWFFSSLPAERLEQYRRDLDSLLTSVQSRGADPILAVHPIRFGATLNADDQNLLESLRTFSPRALPAVMLEFDSAAADVVREMGRRRKVTVVNLPSVMNGRRELFDDAVHYNDVGAGVLAGQIGRTVLRVATERNRIPTKW